MSYSWRVVRQVDNFSGSKSVSSIALVGGLWRITLSVNELNVAPGKLFEVRQSTTTANNGNWTVLALITGTRIFDVAETLVAQVASGSGSATSQGAIKVPATVVTSFVDAQTIQATGALFVTRGVLKGDRLAIYLGALNRGSYYVAAVIDENMVQVASRSLAANPLALGGLTGETLVVYPGYGNVRATDEAAISWATIRAAFPFLVDSEAVQALTLHRIAAIRDVEIAQTGATASEFASEDEIVLHRRTDSQPLVVNHWDLGGIALQSSVRLGRAGSDAYGFSHGSHWFLGPQLSDVDKQTASLDTLRLRAFGSSIRAAGATSIGLLGQLVGTLLIDSAPQLNPDVNAELRQVLLSSILGEPLYSLDDTSTIEDLSFGDSGWYSFLASGSPVIAGFRISDDVYRPPWRLFSVPMGAFRDPREDYLISDLVSYADSTSLARVEYSWLPRFVRLDPSGLAPIPVAGLTVHVYQSFELYGSEAEVSGSPWITDAQGRINGGLPIYLLARTDVFFGARIPNLEMVNRFTVEGPGIRFVNQILKMRSPLDYDVRVQLIETDFEGEVST